LGSFRGAEPLYQTFSPLSPLKGTKEMGLKQIQVKCYSGHTYAQRPESFLWQDKKYKITQVENEWLEPGKRFFRVVTEDEKVFQLCYNETQDQWWLINNR
jgi:hypothetical protein